MTPEETVEVQKSKHCYFVMAFKLPLVVYLRVSCFAEEIILQWLKVNVVLIYLFNFLYCNLICDVSCFDKKNVIYIVYVTR